MWFESSNNGYKELDPDGNGIACDDKDYDFRGSLGATVTPTAATTTTPTVPTAAATEAPATGNGSVATTAPAGGVAATKAPTGLSHTAIYIGDCSPGPFTNPVAQLADPVLPTGNSVGVTPYTPVATSYSTVPVTIDSLTHDAHVLTVFDPKQPNRLLACGTIGGVIETDGALAVALKPSEGSNVSGIAYLSPSGSGISVSLFVTMPGSATTAPTTTPAS